jgi:hypothetical protein
MEWWRMRVVVVAHESIKPLLAAWSRTLGDSPAECRRRFRELWGEFVESLEFAQGAPEQSIQDNRTTPPTFWCNFPGGLAQIIVEPDHHVGLFRKVRRIVVANLNFSPGLSG